MKSFVFSLKFVPKGPIDYKSALVQVMACRQTGDKPLPETMRIGECKATVSPYYMIL